MFKKIIKDPEQWFKLYMPIFAMISFAIVTTYTVDFLFLRKLTGYWYFATYTSYSLFIMLAVLMGAVESVKFKASKDGIEGEIDAECNHQEVVEEKEVDTENGEI